MLAIVTRESDRLLLEWEGPPPRLGPRVLLSLVLLPFWAGPAVLGFAGFLPGSSTAGTVAVGCVLTGWYAVVAGITFLIGLGQITVSRLDVDRAGGELHLRTVGHLIWGWRQRTFSLDGLRRLELDLDTERSSFTTLRLEVEHASATVGASLEVEDRSDRDAILRLALDLARAAGLGAYRLPRNDDLVLEVVLVPEATGKDARPVPASEEAEEAVHSSGEGDEAAVEVPSVDLPPFEPGEAEATEGMEVEWLPGEVVRFRRPGYTVRQRLAAGVAAWSATALILRIFGIAALAGWLAGGIGPTLPALGLGFLGGVGGWFLMGWFRADRETVVDWREGTITHRRGGRRTEVPLEAIERLEVRGSTRTVKRRSRAGRPGSGGGSGRKWACDVLVHLPDGPRCILWTPWKEDREPAYLEATACAEDLADALDVEREWTGFEGAGFADVLRRD